jgi:hypothetical protein
MDLRPGIDGLIVRIDGDLGRHLLAEAAQEVRLAPSLRGVDFVEAGAAVLVTMGSSADFLSLVLARRHLASFAARCARFIRGKKEVEGTTNLRVELSSKNTKMVVDLAVEDDARMVEALRRLAEVAETVMPDEANRLA